MIGRVLPIASGAKPWEPIPDGELVLELDRWDIPLAGLITRRRRPYLFLCLLGETDIDNIWAYARLRKQEFRELQELTGDSLVERMEGCLQRRRIKVALAVEDHVVLTATVRVAREDGIEVVQKFLRQESSRLRRSLERDHLKALQQRPEIAFS